MAYKLLQMDGCRGVNETMVIGTSGLLEVVELNGVVNISGSEASAGTNQSSPRLGFDEFDRTL
jgi:hypothetical protein